MTTPDHIGADPALGVGAGQTRRSTPADLAREVLGRETRLGDFSYSIPLEAQALWDSARSEQVKAAPALARAVLAVAVLADELDAEGNARMDDADPGRAKAAYAHAARIRAALNGGDA